jgi:hypothetical protein
MGFGVTPHLFESSVRIISIVSIVPIAALNQ